MFTGYNFHSVSRLSARFFSSSSISKYTDPYKLLGVTRSDDYKEIKMKYLKLVKKHHPDLDPENQSIFMSIKDAFEEV